MKKLIFTILVQVFIGFTLYGQTITKPPIYEGSESLTVVFNEKNQGVGFLYQNPDYKSIVDIIYFSVPSVDESIELMDKVIFILNMPKTGKNEDILDDFNSIKLVRYSFSQSAVYVGNEKHRGKRFNLKEANAVKSSLLNFKK